MSIEVINETDFTAIDESEFARLSTYVFEQMKIDPLADLTIVFNTEDEMERLHIDWMGLTGPTDVMSFPVDELRPGMMPQRSDSPEVLDLCLGDIAICPSFAAKQAEGSGHTAHEEMLLLAVHGILHLLGYDHIKLDEKTTMFDLQRKLLLGYIASRDHVKVDSVVVKGLPQ